MRFGKVKGYREKVKGQNWYASTIRVNLIIRTLRREGAKFDSNCHENINTEAQRHRGLAEKSCWTIQAQRVVNDLTETQRLSRKCEM